MKTAVLSLSLDVSVIDDAINTLIFVHHELRKRHGEEFRALDRALDELVNSGAQILTLVPMAGGVILAAPSDNVAAVLKEARRLELIR